MFSEYKEAFPTLHLMAKGGNRELYTRDNSQLVIKLEKIKSDVGRLHDNISFPHIKKFTLKKVLNNQRKMLSLFENMYLPSLRPNIKYINGNFYLVTHEPKRGDIYPSSGKEHVTNLCCLGYLAIGNPKDFNPQIKDFILSMLFDDDALESVVEFNKSEVNNIIDMLKEEKAKNTLNEYLSKIELYSREGLMLDLIGFDNVVLVQNNENYELVINSSAAKFERIDTFNSNLENLFSLNCTVEEFSSFAHQICMMVNINMLCHLIKRTRIFTFNTEQQNQINAILNNQAAFYKHIRK